MLTEIKKKKKIRKKIRKFKAKKNTNVRMIEIVENETFRRFFN